MLLIALLDIHYLPPTKACCRRPLVRYRISYVFQNVNIIKTHALIFLRCALLTVNSVDTALRLQGVTLVANVHGCIGIAIQSWWWHSGNSGCKKIFFPPSRGCGVRRRGLFGRQMTTGGSKDS